MRTGGSAAISFSLAPNMEHNYSIDNSPGKWSQPIAELRFNGLDDETRKEWRQQGGSMQCLCVCVCGGEVARGGNRQGPFIRNENMFRS